MEVVTLFCYITFVYYTAIINPQEVWVVWMSEFVYWTLIGGLGFWYLKKGNWREKDI
jgi:Na+-driven multidrug efflux pump